MKEKDMTSVLIIPVRIKNCFLEFFTIKFPIIAACPDPIPGRREHIGADNKAAFIGCFIGMFGIVIICDGIIVLFFIERIIFEAPNRPVRSGSRG